MHKLVLKNMEKPHDQRNQGMMALQGLIKKKKKNQGNKMGILLQRAFELCKTETSSF